MSLVATLVANPAGALLSPALATSAARSVGATGPIWLSPGVACDLMLPPDSPVARVERTLREVLAERPIDIAVQPEAGRRKRVLVADMDSTMIDQECIDELAQEAGLRERVAAITARAMNGEIAFEPALRERVRLLAGLPESIIEKVIAERISLAAGGRELVATMKRHGSRTALVSGGFTRFTEPIGAMLGFDETMANRLLTHEGVLTGEVAEPILGREAKAMAVRRLALETGVEVSDVMAVGDGANDLDMLGIAGAGVALHAKPAVAARAPIRIDHGDLTALLYLQGYRDSDFIHEPVRGSISAFRRTRAAQQSEGDTS